VLNPSATPRLGFEHDFKATPRQPSSVPYERELIETPLSRGGRTGSSEGARLAKALTAGAC
jgi:hypothetical protein